MKAKLRPQPETFTLFDIILKAKSQSNTLEKKTEISIDNNKSNKQNDSIIHHNVREDDKSSGVKHTPSNISFRNDKEFKRELAISKALDRRFSMKSTKKKLSPLKRRIIQDRMKHHLQQSSCVPDPLCKVNDDEYSTMVVYDFVFDCDVEDEDEDERQEIMENLKFLADPFGQVIGIQLVIDSEGTYASLLSPQYPTSNICVLVTFANPASAVSACNALSGLRIIGQTIKTALTNEVVFDTGENMILSSSIAVSSHNLIANSSRFNPNEVLCLLNIVDELDISDEDEKNEVVSDISKICKHYGDVESVWFSSKGTFEVFKLKDDVFTFLEFDSFVNLNCAAMQLQDNYKSMLLCNKDKSAILSWSTNEFEATCPLYPKSYACVRISKFLNCQQFQDEDERIEIFQELFHLAGCIDKWSISFCLPSADNSSDLDQNQNLDIFLEAVDILSCLSLRDLLIKINIGGQNLIADCVVVLKDVSSMTSSIECKILDSSSVLVTSFEELTVLGIISPNFQSENQMFQKGWNSYLVGLIKVSYPHSTKSVLPNTLVTHVHFYNKEAAQQAMMYLEGMNVAGNKLLAFFETCNSTITSIATSNQQSTKKDGEVVAKRLPGRVELLLSDIPKADEEINNTIYNMLNLLSTFQLRAKEKDPVKAKSRIRFVVGMKQVMKGLKAKLVRLVLLAPDTESSEVIDEKLKELVALALREEDSVPCIYCLSRRKLAKACQLSMRQSIVGIYSPDGAFSEFKTIVRYLDSLKR